MSGARAMIILALMGGSVAGASPSSDHGNSALHRAQEPTYEPTSGTSPICIKQFSILENAAGRIVCSQLCF
eukprot:2924845-Amphidinium_carterae.1